VAKRIYNKPPAPGIILPPRLTSKLRLVYNVEIIFRSKEGKLLRKDRKKNLVVEVGREQVALMLATGLSNKIKSIAWGDGGHVVSNPSDFVPQRS